MNERDDANLAARDREAKAGLLRLALGRGFRSPPRPWTRAAGEVLDPEAAAAARTEMRSWPGYRPSPLRPLPGLADRLGVDAVWCKDESGRFGIGSFKALGGAYAVLRVLQDAVEARTGRRPSSRELLDGRVEEARDVTTVTASAGNHGRSVAWGSELFGCRCVVFLPEGTDQARAEAIESHGAAVEWFPGLYDDAVLHADRTASESGWSVVSDTAYAGYEDIPRRVYEGYSLLADEVLETLTAEGEAPPTHLFIQAGVGGLASGVCGHLWSELGPERPVFIAVEPLDADCFARSVRAGGFREVAGPFDTRMGGLASGVPSTLSWELLSGCLDGGVAFDDAVSGEAAAALASGELGATVEAGPSGAAGVGALLALSRLPTAARLFGLDSSSRVLVLVTEKRFA